MSAPNLSVMMPELSPFERHETGGYSVDMPGSGSTTTKALSPAQLDAQKKQDDLLAQQTTLADQQMAQTKAENAVKADVAGQMYDAAGKLQQERDKAMAQTDAEIAEARSRLREANDRYEKQPLPSLFGDVSTGRAILKGLALGVAAIADGARTSALIRAGQAAPQGSAVNDIIEADFARQREKIKLMADKAVMMRAEVKDAEQGRRDLLADLAVKEAAVYSRLEKLQRAQLASLGQSAADIQRNEKVVGYQEKREEARMKAVDGLTTTIEDRHNKTKTGSVTTINRDPSAAAAKGGGGVEADKNAANFELLKEHGTWAAENMKTLTPKDIEDINAARAQGTLLTRSPTAGAAAATLGMDTEAGLSSRAKEYLDRVSRAEDAIGRLKSGGAINAEEGVRFGAMLTPKPSDRTPDLSMRGKNILKDIDLLGSHLDRPARNAQLPVAPTGNSPPAATATPTPTAPPPSAGPQSDRDRAIQIFKAKPDLMNTPKGRGIKKLFNITDQEVSGG